MGKKNKGKFADPFASREAAKYDNPIASRELILQVLEQAQGPLSHRALCKKLELIEDDVIEALRRRLIAMVRDGQLISNRKGAYGIVDKMDLVRGRVLAHRDGYGFVRPKEGGDDIYLSNRQMRKVFDGDEVLLRVGAKNFRGQYEGAIVEILERNTEQVAGQFINDRGHCFVTPDNPKIHHDIFIDADSTMGAQHGQIVVAELIQQPGRHQRAQGRIKEILGDHLAPGMEIDVAIRSHGIPHLWPDAVQNYAAGLSAEVSDADKLHRVDLRHLPFVTIDGEDARDFDDAVYCETKKAGGWRLFVAIADVSHYVEPGSALDTEAVKRGNSVYFPNNVVPMLPEALSNGLCSLNPLVDRLCMVCEMTISAAGRISGYQFYEAVMHSKARLTYTEVGSIIADRGKARSASRKKRIHLLDDLDNLHDLFLVLKSIRSNRGAIDFETTETRILFDEARKISQIVPVERNDAHRLIEECMLAANVCAAKFLEAHELPCLYRIHEPPKTEKLEQLIEYLAGLGLTLPQREQVRPEDYQSVLEKARGRVDGHLIQTVMLRSMNQAVYQPANLGHFGLAFPAYTHFTSPIRRYPDLLVHRAIRSIVRSTTESRKVKRVSGAALIAKNKIFPYDLNQMESLGEQCSHCERRADDATRDVVSWLKCEYLQEHVGEEFEGVISAVTGFGLFVELKSLYIEGLIHITSLPQDYYHFDATRHSLSGERRKLNFHLGDALRVQVARVSLDDRKIDFELVETKRTKKPSRRGKEKVAARGETLHAEEGSETRRLPRKRPAKKDSEDNRSLTKDKNIKPNKKKAKTKKKKKS